VPAGAPPQSKALSGPANQVQAEDMTKWSWAELKWFKLSEVELSLVELS
jgi:hypothetical protein